jgi:HK97 gp10 family phage protein
MANQGIKFKIINKVPEAIDWIKDGMAKNMEGAVIEWHGTLVDEVLVGNRSGRIYKVPFAKKKMYQASAPGEPPARRTGDLAGEYGWKVNRNSMWGAIGNPLEYSLYLETGTRKMKPRPALKPAFRKGEKRIVEHLNRRFDDGK